LGKIDLLSLTKSIMRERNAQHLEYKYFVKKVLTVIWLLILVWFLYNISSILVLLVLSLFLCVLFSPLLNKLNKWKINDLIWIILIFLWLLLVVALIIFLIVPLIVNQFLVLVTWVTDGANNLLDIYNKSWIHWFWLPPIVENFINSLNIEQVLTLIKENSTQISSFLWSNLKTFITSGAWVIFSVGSWVFNFVLLFLFTIFIVLERKNARQVFYAILPKKLSEYVYDNEKEVTHILTIWLKWQLILGIAMFFLTLFWLLILKIFWIHINWILSLALIALFMEFIPFLWTFISMFLALSISLWTWLNGFIWVLIVYLIIQQIEWNFLVPYIMGKTLSLSPFIVLISMIIWWALFWIIWVLFTIPVISIIKVFLRPYIIKREKENKFIK
jgi:predicted PurR-regulated permease PerM